MVADGKRRRESEENDMKWQAVLLITMIFALMTIGTILVFGGPHWPIHKYKSTKLVIISIDGLPANMISYANTPHMSILSDDGIFTPMLPSFPSHTFPNHYTMMTGLAPSKHGIINNVFIDPQRNEIFRSKDPGTSEDGSWVTGEPFWMQVERDGGASAVVHWAGAASEFNGKRPRHHQPFNRSMTSAQVTDTILSFVAKGVSLVVGYYAEVDRASHKHGVHSLEFQQALASVDEEMDRVRKALPKDTNLIIVSDHGSVNVHRHYSMSSLLSDYHRRLTMAACSPVTFIYPRPGETGRVFRLLQRAVKELNDTVKVHRHFPSHWHFTNNIRIPSIILECSPGYTIDCDVDQSSSGSGLSRDGGRRDEDHHVLNGDHGYDPSKCKEMLSVFIGHGPVFKADSMSISRPRAHGHVPRNVDVYSVLSDIFEISPGHVDAGPELGRIVLKSFV